MRSSRRSQPWVRSGEDDELAARRRRFRTQLTYRRDRFLRRTNLLGHLQDMAAAAIALAFLYIALVFLSPWPPLVTIRHVLAAPSCDFARLMALAPARQGEPGYWPQHDADRDGIACEPRRYPRRR